MGQQQLLLIVAGIILVGIGLIVGITAYSEASARNNSDALLQDALRVVSDSRTWKTKPELFDGSPDASKSDPHDYSELDFFHLGYSGRAITDDGDCYKNSNGEFALFASTKFLGVLATNVTNQNMVGVIVTGSGGTEIQLYAADWNPVVGGVGSDGVPISVESHKRCKGRGQTPLHAGVN